MAGTAGFAAATAGAATGLLLDPLANTAALGWQLIEGERMLRQPAAAAVSA